MTGELRLRHQPQTKEPEMALSDKIRRMMNSPQGRRVVERGRRELEKPENRRRVQRLLEKVAGRKRHR